MGKPFPRVFLFLKKRLPDIICLQEMPLSERKLRRLKALDGYNLAVSRQRMVHAKNHHTIANIILSKFLIRQKGDLNFDEGPSERRIRGFGNWHEKTIVVWVEAEVGGIWLRIYNCHLRVTGVGPKERLADMQKVFEHARTAPGPVIICGDMNTVLPRAGLTRKFIQWFHKIPKDSLNSLAERYSEDERYVYQAAIHQNGFRDLLPLAQSTWAIPGTAIELFKLKLDWFLVKNISVGQAEFGPYISDHRPVAVAVEL